MNIITKEYLSSVKMNLQGRNNLSTSEHFQGSYPCEFYPLGISDCLFRNNSNDNKNAYYANKEDFFPPKGIISLMNDFYSAGVIQRFCCMKGDVSLGKKFVNLISSSISISIKNFSEARGFLPVLRFDSGDSTTSASTT